MKQPKRNFSLTIGWLYPKLMSTYGDRGNIICLQKRCQWRKILCKVVEINQQTNRKKIGRCDLILGGGAQDRQQEIVISDLIKKKKIYIHLFQKGIPGLFVCGSPQLLGQYYMTGEGKILKGLGIFDFFTKHFGHHKKRCIGDTAGELLSIIRDQLPPGQKTIVGFENHGGRTYLENSCQPLAKVLVGFGNNGEDGFEGAVYNNVIACYYHGPFLPKNPHIADWLIAKAVEVKYKKKIELKPLNDDLEWLAHKFILKRLKIDIDDKYGKY